MQKLHALVGVALVVAALGAGCESRPAPRVAPDQSKLKVATDLFWALDKLGYAISKEKPPAARRGCEPSEYLAQKQNATFRISVFDCKDPAQTRALVEDDKTQHVDSLLRNHGEGGILQRGALEIVVRMTQGDRKAAEALLAEIGGL